MIALSELSLDLKENKALYLIDPTRYNQFITQLNEFVSNQHELASCKELTSDMLKKLSSLKGQATSEKIGELAQLLQTVKSLRSPMASQKWFIEKMNDLGYNVSMYGQCFGMSHMAMNAFLAEDETTFDTRLKTIFHLSTHVIKKDIVANKKIDPHHLDILAFFDTLAIYQEPRSFLHLFDFHVGIQNAEQVSSVISPTYFTTQPKKKPTLIKTIGGSYNLSTLTIVIDLLKNNFKEHIFSLMLSSNCHTIVLNYHSQNQWTLVDPNHLPAKSYKRPELLAEAIFDAFFIGKVNGEYMCQLLLATELYTQQQNQSHFIHSLEFIKNEKALASLHNIQHDNLSFLLKMYCRSNAVTSIQDLLDQGVPVTDEVFIIYCQYGSIEAATLLLTTSFIPTQALLDQRPFSELHCPLTWGKWIQSIGLIPPLSLLSKALLEIKDISMAQALIEIGAQPTEMFFHQVCFNDESFEAINFLLSRGIKPNPALIVELYELNHINLAKHLIFKGIQPTDDLILKACQRQDYDMVNILLLNSRRPSFETLNSICNTCDSQMSVFVIASHPEIISCFNTINSYGLANILNYPACISIITSLSDKVHLSVLQHLKQSGTRLSHHSLGYACWRNNEECVRWLLNKNINLPFEEFNALKSSLKPNIIKLLDSPTRREPPPYEHNHNFNQSPRFFISKRNDMKTNVSDARNQSTFNMLSNVS